MTKVGRMIFEDGMEVGWKNGKEEGKEEERIAAIVNMLEFDVSEQKILRKYSQEDLLMARKALAKGN